jgi:predicted RNA-binding Zn ribbon-like protein
LQTKIFRGNSAAKRREKDNYKAFGREIHEKSSKKTFNRENPQNYKTFGHEKDRIKAPRARCATDILSPTRVARVRFPRVGESENVRGVLASCKHE